MVRVCENEFPAGSGRNRKDGFYMNDILKQQLDIYLKNVKNDWDFVIIISGEGEVRVGKSVLALQIAKYWQSQIKKMYNRDVPFNIEDNIVFNGSNLIEKGNKLGSNYPYGCLVFDEAGADLKSKSVMSKETQQVMDYLRECGQYNMLTILVLPDYFDLPKGVALNRSNCLLNVYWSGDSEGNMNKGYFKFFSKPKKKQLYLNGKKYLNYGAAKQDFYGSFNNFYPVDEQEYRNKKKHALKKREKLGKRERKRLEFLKSAFKYMRDRDLAFTEVAEEISKRSPIKCNYKYVQRLVDNDEETDE